MPPRRTFRGFELRRALFILPNAFTVASIFCGLYAILHGARANDGEALYQSAMAVFFAGFFDLFDGRVARLTKTQSDFGVQLDSLADMVSFGVAPAIIVYKWALFPLDSMGFFNSLGMVGAFIFAACGAIRLARFNVLAARGVSSHTFFVGLPIPLAASMLIAMVMAHVKLFGDLPLQSYYPVLGVVIALSILMVSSIPFWSFKEFHFTLKWIVVLGALLLMNQLSLRQPLSVIYVTLISTYILAGIGRATYLVVFKKKKLNS